MTGPNDLLEPVIRGVRDGAGLLASWFSTGDLRVEAVDPADGPAPDSGLGVRLGFHGPIEGVATLWLPTSDLERLRPQLPTPASDVGSAVTELGNIILNHAIAALTSESPEPARFSPPVLFKGAATGRDDATGGIRLTAVRLVVGPLRHALVTVQLTTSPPDSIGG